jgi:hypothetical protein
LRRHREPFSPTRNHTAELLEAVRAFILRYVVLRDENQAVTLALWILHTHAIDAAVCTPYLSILSPEKRSGKSLLLEVLATITARAEHVMNISPAALFRIIEAGPPTMLLDEVDALFKSDGERAEELRGIINSGNRRGVTVWRCHGPAHEVRSFKVFCAKALGGIDNGTLPDTVRDRSIAIRMRRKTRDDRVERWLLQRVESEAMELHERIAGWAERYTEALTAAEPELPEALTDRQQEAWWALLAIAELLPAAHGRRRRERPLWRCPAPTRTFRLACGCWRRSVTSWPTVPRSRVPTCWPS